MAPCYASEDFKAFLQECRVVHYTSSPHYPQSNGLAEATVKLSKRLIEKAVLQGKPWNALLLQHRITPLSSDIPSPAEILFGRKLRTEAFHTTQSTSESKNYAAERMHSEERR